MLDLKNFFFFFFGQSRLILVSCGVDESLINSDYLGAELACSSAWSWGSWTESTAATSRDSYTSATKVVR